MDGSEAGRPSQDVPLVVIGHRPEGTHFAGRPIERLAASDLEDTSRCTSAVLAVVSAPVLEEADPSTLVEAAARRGLELVLLAVREGGPELLSWLAAGASVVATPESLERVIDDRLRDVAIRPPPE